MYGSWTTWISYPLHVLKSQTSVESNKTYPSRMCFAWNTETCANFNPNEWEFLLIGALAYAELGTMNPSSGAEYVYFMDAFGSFAAYMFSWTSALILKPSQIAIICLSFAEYVVEYFASGCEISDFAVKVISVITIREYSIWFLADFFYLLISRSGSIFDVRR